MESSPSVSANCRSASGYCRMEFMICNFTALSIICACVLAHHVLERNQRTLATTPGPVPAFKSLIDGITGWRPPPRLDHGQTRINRYHHPRRYLNKLNNEDDDDEDDC
jgi:hypothetical protein